MENVNLLSIDALMMLLIMLLEPSLCELIDMKKCNSCGATRENCEKMLRKYNEDYYCIFCFDDDGKPMNSNKVRQSIKNFWHQRYTSNQKQKENGS